MALGIVRGLRGAASDVDVSLKTHEIIAASSAAHYDDTESPCARPAVDLSVLTYMLRRRTRNDVAPRRSDQLLVAIICERNLFRM